MQHDRVLALGFFDGIHLGHAALLNKTRERARELSLTPAAMSFDTHPDTLVFGTSVPLLNTMAERELLMRRLCGIEEVIFAHFDEAMMHMPWEVFIEDYLVRQLRAMWSAGTISISATGDRGIPTGCAKNAAHSASAAM